MKTLLLADRHGDELEPLTDRIATALLPVAGKPMLVHTIEEIVLSGIADVEVVVGPFSDQIKDLLKGGERWGLNVTFQLTRGERSVDAIAEHARAEGEEADLLLVRGDVMRSAGALAAFIEHARAAEADFTQAWIGDQDAGMWFMRGRSEIPSVTAWNLDDEDELVPLEPSTRLSLDGHEVHRIVSLSEYHRINVRVATQDIEGIAPVGRERRPGFWAAPRAQVRSVSVRESGIIVGLRCDVDGEAMLEAGAVLSENIYVDRHATVRNSVVLPNTYVGEMVSLDGVIAWQNMLIDAESGAVTEVADDFILGTLEPPTLGSFVGWLSYRLAAAFVLLLSLPLWSLAWLLAHSNRDGETRIPVTMMGNVLARDERGRVVPECIETWEWNTSVPILRHLPKLLPAVRGDIRLVGVSPLSPQEHVERTEAWELVRDEAPVGLLGPAQLELPASASTMERVMADAVYVRERNVLKDLGVIRAALNAFFSKRAFIGAGYAKPAADTGAPDSYPH